MPTYRLHNIILLVSFSRDSQTLLKNSVSDMKLGAEQMHVHTFLDLTTLYASVLNQYIGDLCRNSFIDLKLHCRSCGRFLGSNEGCW